MTPAKLEAASRQNCHRPIVRHPPIISETKAVIKKAASICHRASCNSGTRPSSSLNNMELSDTQKAEATARASETNTAFPNRDWFIYSMPKARPGKPHVGDDEIRSGRDEPAGHSGGYRRRFSTARPTKPFRISPTPPISRCSRRADEPAHAHTRQFRDNFIEFLRETVLVADRLVHQVVLVGSNPARLERTANESATEAPICATINGSQGPRRSVSTLTNPAAPMPTNGPRLATSRSFSVAPASRGRKRTAAAHCQAP